MLRVTVEMVSYGLKDLTKKLYEIKVWNTGTGTVKVGNYEYQILSAAEGDTSAKLITSGALQGFNRRKGALALLETILNKERSSIEKDKSTSVKKG